MTHQISKYCLGPNWKQAIEKIIQNKVEEIGLALYADVKTGENNLELLRKFQNVEQELIEACHQKVRQYFQAVTLFRQVNNLNPFNLERETRERIKAAIAAKYYKPPEFRKLREAKPKSRKSTDNMSVRELATPYRIKPEYQGKNHPLEVSQKKWDREKSLANNFHNKYSKKDLH